MALPQGGWRGPALEPGDAETQVKMSVPALWTELDLAQKRRASQRAFRGPLAAEGAALLSTGERSEFTDTILSVHPSDVLDMPVDPNEPTYCLCHQVSYGEMIGCDNPDCPIEWFHFACVDLTTKPKGKWFCPRCVQEKRKKK
ncbi:hypothetical protein H8959_012217 [Pygathrix nigripes]